MSHESHEWSRRHRPFYAWPIEWIRRGICEETDLQLSTQDEKFQLVDLG